MIRLGRVIFAPPVYARLRERYVGYRRVLACRNAGLLVDGPGVDFPAAGEPVLAGIERATGRTVPAY